MKTWKPNYRKYNNIRTRCSLGHYHPSKGESMYCQKLQLLVKAKEIESFEYEKRYPLVVKDKTIGNHKPDFTVTNNDGTETIHEFKGVMTADWKLRKALCEVLYPDIEYKVVGQGDL